MVLSWLNPQGLNVPPRALFELIRGPAAEGGFLAADSESSLSHSLSGLLTNENSTSLLTG